MAEGLMSLRPRKVVDYVCDEVDSDAFMRKEGSRGKKKREKNFYAVAYYYAPR